MRFRDDLSPETIVSGLRTVSLGRMIVYTPVTGSTNDDARRLAGECSGSTGGNTRECPSGTLVLCDTQTGGKGRLGRQWASPRGGIFMSLVLFPDIPPSKVPLLSLVAGYSVASAIRSLTGLDARVKWPNDVLVDGMKVSGILSEVSFVPGEHEGSPNVPPDNGRIGFVVCGIGINANQRETDFPAPLRKTATSIRILTGRPVDRNVLIAAVLNEMETALDRFYREGLAGLREDLTRISAYLGEAVSLRNRSAGDAITVTGVFRGIDEGGRAMVEVPGGGVKPFSAGDLTLRPK